MQVKIEKIVFEGWGIGRIENGKTVLVKKTVPGDLVEAKILKEKKSYAEGIIQTVLEPGPKRILPPCPYFDLCGGCDHQNLSYENQLALKEEIFKETLLRAGLSIKPETIIPASASPFFYRNSIRFFLVPDGKILSLARQSIEGGGKLVKVKSCLLQSEKSGILAAAILETINKWIEDKRSFLQIKIRQGNFGQEFMAEIITTPGRLIGKEKFIQNLRHWPEIKSLYHTTEYDPDRKKARRTLLSGRITIRDKIGRFSFQISPESFFQTNSPGVKTLFDKIKEYAEIKINQKVLDLFCGAGPIGIYLSTMAETVTGIETVPEAVRDANDNTRLNKIHNCRYFNVEVLKWLEREAKKTEKPFFDVVIADPPRAGLGKETVKLLAKLDFGRLIYVSCNPATFGRDAAELEKQGVSLQKVQPVDMFPQTRHIESVGLFQKTPSL